VAGLSATDEQGAVAVMVLRHAGKPVVAAGEIMARQVIQLDNLVAQARVAAGQQLHLPILTIEYRACRSMTKVAG